MGKVYVYDRETFQRLTFFDPDTSRPIAKKQTSKMWTQELYALGGDWPPSELTGFAFFRRLNEQYFAGPVKLHSKAKETRAYMIGADEAIEWCEANELEIPAEVENALGLTDATFSSVNTEINWSEYLNVGQWKKVFRATRTQIGPLLKEMKKSGTAEKRTRQSWRVVLSSLSNDQRTRYDAVLV